MALARRSHYTTLLRVRKRQEERRALALAKALREQQHAEAERAHLTAEQRRALERAGDTAQEAFDAAEVRCYYQYERHLAQLGDAKDAEIREFTRMSSVRRLELEEATKNKRMIERLRERTEEILHAQSRRDEQRRLDEVATNHAALGMERPGTHPAEEKRR